MIFTYRFHHTGYRKSAASDKIQIIHADLKRYMATAEKLKSKTEERKTVLEKKQALPVFRVIQHREVSRVIAELTEEIEELRTEKNMLLKKLNCEKDGDLPKVEKSISEMESVLQELGKQEEKYRGELNNSLKEFADIKERAKDFDELELIDERLSIRPQKQQEFNEYVETCGVAVNSKALENTLYDIDSVLLQENLETERRSIFRTLEHYKAQQHREEHKETRHVQCNDEWDLELYL